MSGYQPVQTLTPRHYQILDLAVSGLNATSIATQLGMSRGQVSLILASPSFQHQFALRRKSVEAVQDNKIANELDDVKSELQASALAAAKKLISGIDSADEKIAIRSATEILDRTGYPKEQKVTGSAGNTIVINSTDMKILTESLAMTNENQ